MSNIRTEYLKATEPPKLSYTPPLWPGVKESDFNLPPKPEEATMPAPQRYRLLKPLPYAPVDTEYYKIEGTNDYCPDRVGMKHERFYLHKDWVEGEPDWFQPIDPDGQQGGRTSEYSLVFTNGSPDSPMFAQAYRFTPQGADATIEAIRAVLAYIQKTDDTYRTEPDEDYRYEVREARRAVQSHTKDKETTQ